MKIIAPLLVLAFATISQGSLAADQGTAAISELGELNGIALACQQPALVTRARNIVITAAPKTRDYGEIFENATNAAYLEQGKGKTACPDAPTLAARIAAAEKRLQAAFPAAQ